MNGNNRTIYSKTLSVLHIWYLSELCVMWLAESCRLLRWPCWVVRVFMPYKTRQLRLGIESEAYSSSTLLHSKSQTHVLFQVYRLSAA